MDEQAYRMLAEYNGSTKRLDEVYRQVAKCFTLPECAFWILYTLRIEPRSFTQTDICDFLYSPKQTVNSALKKLERDGYIAFSAGDDQRSKKISLTEQGKALAVETVDKIINAEATALQQMPQNDREALIRTTSQYCDLLKNQFQTLKRKG